MSDVITTDGDVTGVVEDMERSHDIARSGQTFSARAALGDDAPPPPEPQPAPDLQELGLTGIVEVGRTLVKARPAETVDTSGTDRPGLTVRGWSPEVTARHPALLAETMAELSADAAATAEPVDPTDLEGLNRARAAFSTYEAQKVALQNAAIKLNFKRLGAGLNEAAGNSPAVQAAMAEAVEEAQAIAGPGDEATAAPAPTPAPAPTGTSSTSSTTSTTPASTSA